MLQWSVPSLGATTETAVDQEPGTAERTAAQERVTTFDAAWQIIDESYFDSTFHGLDWGAVRAELRPKAEAAKSTAALREVIEEMLERLGDSHMALIPREVAQSLPSAPGSTNELDRTTAAGSSPDPTTQEPSKPHGNAASREGDVGLEVRVQDGRALVVRVDEDGPAAAAGVKAGWLLTAIDSEKIRDLLEPLAKGSHRHRAQFLGWSIITGKLGGTPGSGVRLEFLTGDDESVSLELKRRRVPGEPSKLGYLPTLYSRFTHETLTAPGGGSVVVMRFNIWMVPIIHALDRTIDQSRSAAGIVIDMRGNLGGIGGMILGISGHFLNERVSLGTLKMRGNDLNFFTNPRRVNSAGERVEPYAGPLAILIDDISLSAAEIFAGGMQAVGRARVFGERSGGQALPAIWDRLPNGDVLYHAFGDFVTASGARLEGVGVSPDETVPYRREDLLAGRDAALNAALSWIGRQKGSAPSGVAAPKAE